MSQGESQQRASDSGPERAMHSGPQAQESGQPPSGLQTDGAMQVEPAEQAWTPTGGLHRSHVVQISMYKTQPLGFQRPDPSLECVQ